MEPLILKLLDEVDEDIKEIMLSLSTSSRPNYGPYYKYWELLSSPLMEILAWQSLRDRNEELMKKAELCQVSGKQS